MALQPGETWHPELNLSRADVKFHYDEHGALYAVLMMRPCKNGKYMRGKTVPIVLAGGGTLIDPVSALWELYAGDPVPGHRRVDVLGAQRSPVLSAAVRFADAVGECACT